eukprot:8298976-Pyramimonas_sp.AAC.1
MRDIKPHKRMRLQTTLNKAARQRGSTFKQGGWPVSNKLQRWLERAAPLNTGRVERIVALASFGNPPDPRFENAEAATQKV